MLRFFTTAAVGLWLTIPANDAVADSPPSLIGMWRTTLTLGNSDVVYDEALEHYHGDGTHLLISNGLPPALGNVCIGIYKKIGPRTYKLRHMTWNWSPDPNTVLGDPVPGTWVGRFELNLILRLDERGNSYRGTWSVKNFDTDENHMPAYDVSGVVRGTRINVN
jgi:hypothetical protein